MGRQVGRSETCSTCGAWLRSCVNCRFYSPGRHNDCAENMAEPVADKRASNFCDFFIFKESKTGGSSRGASYPKSARNEFKRLFGD
ncbi:MAG: hypothetical protein JXQ30_17275 [Spirochaetes bacterium]|nr:hypothetical protein [Spirochaetota bacterium]